MMVKNTCIVCGNDDPNKITYVAKGEVCDVCDSTLISNDIIDDDLLNLEFSYTKLF